MVERQTESAGVKIQFSVFSFQFSVFRSWLFLLFLFAIQVIRYRFRRV
jgi:hypothetical protein